MWIGFFVYGGWWWWYVLYLGYMKGIAALFDTDMDTLREGTGGRSERLMGLRDSALCYRYYFYMRYRHYNYIKTCQELSNEFYISVIQVQKVLRVHGALLQSFRAAPPTLKQLSVLYPHICWVVGQ